MEEIEKLLKKNPHIHYFRQDAKEFLFRLFTSRKKETKPKRVLIISDHPIFRKGTKSIIEGDNRFKWIAESGNGHRAIELTQRHQPDLVVVDISL
jgi:PleD family two-component response regulator